MLIVIVALPSRDYTLTQRFLRKYIRFSPRNVQGWMDKNFFCLLFKILYYFLK
jgi:hypothetical protein